MSEILKWTLGIDTSNPWNWGWFYSGYGLVLISLLVVFLINGGIGATIDRLMPKRTHRRRVEAYLEAHPEQKLPGYFLE